MNTQIHSKSYLELIIGPMFSGKTSYLISLYKLYKISGKSVCVINYKKDTRYSDTKLSSHDQIMIDCIFVETLDELNKYHNITQYDVLLINEGQFFNDIFDFTKSMVDIYQKIVYISGLDGNYKRQPFNNCSLLKLIPLSDNVIKKHAICKNCNDGTHAIFTHRITDNTEEKSIGGDDQYIPLCRSCYLMMVD